MKDLYFCSKCGKVMTTIPEGGHVCKQEDVDLYNKQVDKIKERLEFQQYEMERIRRNN